MSGRERGAKPKEDRSKNVRTVADLNPLRVEELKNFLRVRGIGLSGNRPQLLELSRLYFR